jgi:calcineurin-like phosphoesterase family protein
MDTTYLVEIRLGRTKWRIKQQIAAITGRFGLEEYRERHPHVTLFGPFFLDPGTTEEELLTVLGDISGSYDPIPFLIDGWEKREGMRGSVIAFPVRPSGALTALVQEIALALLPHSETQNRWDADPDKKWFHITIANHLDPVVATEVFDCLSRQPAGSCERGLAWFQRILTIIRRIFPQRTTIPAPILLDETGLRITLLKGEDILAEYDLLKKGWIFGGHDHTGSSWRDTLKMFRQVSGYERYAPAQVQEEDCFVIADLHLGHANIIRYCSRPFQHSGVNEMDDVLMRNWNSVIGDKTRIYHIGDFRYGMGAPPVDTYAERLRGTITFLAGNHDDGAPAMDRSALLDYEGFRFLLVHDPADAPVTSGCWVIHGHHHNNDLRRYPFLDPVARRINVSAEVVGYVPVSLREICHSIRNAQNNPDTGPVLLRTPPVPDPL